MNYHLNQGGKDVGVFPLEELRRRRDTGELTGSELVWCDGMPQWQPLNTVLQAARPKFIAPPPIPPGQKRDMHPVVSLVLVIAVVSFIAGATIFGIMVYRAVRVVSTISQTGRSTVNSSAMQAARRPVVCQTNTQIWKDVQREQREFRIRQYIRGYQLRGQRNPECDLLAQQFLTNWIAYHYGGKMDTNQPSLTELADRLANDPACQDPLVLTLAGVEAAELHESGRRLERAVKGFENSNHRGYPKFYATVTLADKLVHNQADRLPVLDAQSLQYLKAAFSDGSFQPGDQADIAETLINGWGSGFRNRNGLAVYQLVQNQGDAYQWLAQVLDGEYHIDEAWRARGNGYANSVSEAGWQGFNSHLALARQSLTRAWELHPELPLAPCRMMTVALGESDIGEMRKWFDRATAAQVDYAGAWKEMRWGLRPRWYGDYQSMLAFGVTALKTHRFDTDVPRKFFDSVSDVESEMDLPAGHHIYARADVWPHLQELYEGYIAEPSLSAYDRDGWRSAYSVIAYLAGKYDIAQKQLLALNWEPHASNLTGWNRDLSLMPQEVAARTGPASTEVTAAESRYAAGDVAGAVQAYQGILASVKADTQTRLFVQERLAALRMEQRLQGGGWVDFLPTDNSFTGWHIGFGKFKLLPDGALEVQSDENGHLMYCRAHVGTEFEARGQFEVVSSSSTSFQAGLAMGLPQFETYNWYAFRIKRHSDEGDVASFSQQWLRKQILAPAQIDSHTNSFDFRFQNGLVTATINGREVFKNAAPPRNSYVNPNEFLLGLGAFNDSNSTVIRYRNLQVRRL